MKQHKHTFPIGSSKDTLCCCEYENLKGERSHILACCCDCEAFDELADRCLTCKAIPSPMWNKFLDTLGDRCRFPGMLGGGAIKLRLDLVLPIVVVPLSLSLATIGPITTLLVLTSMPIFMLVFYRQWRRQTSRMRTPFFFIWGLASVGSIFVIFEGFVMPFREVLLWENILLCSLMGLMFHFAFRARRAHGALKARGRTHPQSFRFKDRSQEQYGHQPSPEEDIEMKDFTSVQMKREEINNYNSVEEMTAPSLDESKVTWVDSRPIIDGKLQTWCSECQIRKPSRSGHCNVCKSCFPCRDHHCVWIDCCIGSHNHRPFLCAMFLFLVCGFYGSHLTMTTICTPQMYFDWFLVPNDCRFLYIDFQTAVSFVGVLYTLMVSCVMSVGFAHQLLLISQNITSQELHVANRRGMTSCAGLVARNNVHNRGFIRNWVAFFLWKREGSESIQI